MKSLVKKRQSIVEYILIFVLMGIALLSAELFIFGFQGGSGSKGNFSGELIKLHDRIISVISAPIP